MGEAEEDVAQGVGLTRGLTKPSLLAEDRIRTNKKVGTDSDVHVSDEGNYQNEEAKMDGHQDMGVTSGLAKQVLAEEQAEEEDADQDVVLTRGLAKQFLAELTQSSSEAEKALVLERWGMGQAPQAWRCATRALSHHLDADALLAERW